MGKGLAGTAQQGLSNFERLAQTGDCASFLILGNLVWLFSMLRLIYEMTILIIMYKLVFRMAVPPALWQTLPYFIPYFFLDVRFRDCFCFDRSAGQRCQHHGRYLQLSGSELSGCAKSTPSLSALFSGRVVSNSDHLFSRHHQSAYPRR